MLSWNTNLFEHACQKNGKPGISMPVMNIHMKMKVMKTRNLTSRQPVQRFINRGGQNVSFSDIHMDHYSL